MSEQYLGAVYIRELDDAVVVVYPMLYNDRVCFGPKDVEFYDRGFCFPKDGSAIEAAKVWSGEGDPPGPWIKEVGTNRYGPGSSHEQDELEPSDL